MSDYRRPSPPAAPSARGKKVRLAEPPEDPDELVQRARREQAKLIAQQLAENERARDRTRRKSTLGTLFVDLLSYLFRP